VTTITLEINDDYLAAVVPDGICTGEGAPVGGEFRLMAPYREGFSGYILGHMGQLIGMWRRELVHEWPPEKSC